MENSKNPHNENVFAKNTVTIPPKEVVTPFSATYEEYDSSFMSNYNQIEYNNIQNLMDKNINSMDKTAVLPENQNLPDEDINFKETFKNQENKVELENMPLSKSINEVFTKSEMDCLIEDINKYLIFEDDSKIKKQYSILADDYLPTKDSKFYDVDEKKLKSDYENLISEYDFHYDLQKLKDQIQKFNLNSKNPGSINVGPVSSLDFLVEMSYNSDIKRKNSIIEKMISLDDIVSSWRKIGGDGNCYYRAVIFAYLEHILFNKDESLLQYLILDMKRVFTEEFFLMKKLEAYKIKSDLIIKIMVLLYSLKDNEIESYELLLKCFNSCKSFDLGMIYYLRFKIFQFIRANENKLYTQEFSVKIGNLLPAEYETEEGDFLYEKFYQDYLMQLFKDAEKIIIYLTPFVLKVNLKILIYDYGTNSLEQLKEFPYRNKNSNLTISLLYRKNHYDLIYQSYYFNKYIKFLSHYVNLDENLKIINSELLEQLKSIKNERKNKILQQDELQKIFSDDNNHVILKELEKKELSESIYQQSKDVNEIDNQIINENISQNKNKSIINYKNKSSVPEQIYSDINSYIPNLKCSICKGEYIPNQTLIKLCRDCLFGEIKSQILSKYFNYMAASRGNFFYKADSSQAKSLFNLIFYNSDMNILGQNYAINDLLKLIDTEFLKFYYNEVKSGICASCDKSVDNKASVLSQFCLPCQCVLCSPQCLSNYLKLVFSIDPKSRKKDFMCVCSHNYSKKELKRLLYFLHSNSCRSAKDKLIEVFRERCINLCMFCLDQLQDGKFGDNLPIICDLTDPETENILNLKIFNHLMCRTCLGDNFNKEYFFQNKKAEIGQDQYCMICDGIHFMKTIKVSSKPVSYKSDCKII